MGKCMGRGLILKVTLGLVVFSLVPSAYSSDVSVGSLSDGSCWYEFKESLKVASFNDKTVFTANKAQIESQIESLIAQSRSIDHQKINEMDLALHCGGYGASLVARVTLDNSSVCVWTKFEKGKLTLRSIGAINELDKTNDLCDGHKWGEFILGINDSSFIADLKSEKWAFAIKEVTRISDRAYKVSLVKDYTFREAEVANLLEENFTGKNFIRYIEFNNYQHPVGDFIPLK